MKAYVVESPRALYGHQGMMFVHPIAGKFVYANSPGRGIVRQSVEEFCDGRPLKVIREANGSAYYLLARISAAPRRPYDWLGWNCEHFVSWVESGEPMSQQLRAYAGFATVALLLWAGSQGKAMRA